MDGTWLTYAELGVRLGTSAEGARRRAMRGRWARMKGNDGKARVCCPDDVLAELEARRPDSSGDGRPDVGMVRPENQALITSLESHVATLKADVDRLEALLAGERERADAEAAKSAEVIRASAAQFAHERERADRAIAAFESLAQRLEAIAEARRPWWRRLVG